MVAGSATMNRRSAAQTRQMKNPRQLLKRSISCLLLCLPVIGAFAQEAAKPPIRFINTSFENASLVGWSTDSNQVVNIDLIYDRQRESPNRANGHWFFQVQSWKGSDIQLLLNNFDNIWNGNHASAISEKTNCYISLDGSHWSTIPAHKTKDNKLSIAVHAPADSFYLAGVEPYRISDLEILLKDIRASRLVSIDTIGATVQGRPLEIVRIGNPDAAHNIFIRARAHGFEAGGSWAVQGIIREMLSGDADARNALRTYCLYILPMTNKDAVARGRTRFNSQGIDLNRGWGVPADATLAPENVALEKWLQALIAQGRKPDLAIDFHNDAEGHLHLAPPGNNQHYLANMGRFEALLKQYTWYTEGTIGGNGEFRNPSAVNEGLLQRYGIDAVVYELNYEWAEGLHRAPFGKDWEDLGKQLVSVFTHYFNQEPEKQ